MEKEILRLERLLREQAEIKANRFLSNCFEDSLTALHEIDSLLHPPDDMGTKYFSIDEVIMNLENVRDEHTVIDGKVNKYHILQCMLNLERTEVEEYFFMEYFKKLEEEKKH